MNDRDLDLLLDPFHLRTWFAPRRVLPVEVAFVPGRAKGNWESTTDFPGILRTTVLLYRRDGVASISIPGSDGSFVDGERVTTGYPGWKVCHAYLANCGIPKGVILPTRGEGLHTRSETDDFLLQAREYGWQRGLIIMNPHETLRVMLGAIAAMKQMEYCMMLRPVTPTRTNWRTEVFGSQGQKRAHRVQHIPEELRRVVAYQKKGDLASFEELSAYYTDILGVPWPKPC